MGTKDSSIFKAFESLGPGQRKGFIPFITAGDPDSETTLKLMHLFSDLGATVIELGVPFSDPMADGPVIQASSQRVLDSNNLSISEILAIVSEFKKNSSVPVLLFGYSNPFYRFGIERIAKEGAANGVDGLLITDVIDDEFDNFSKRLASQGLDLITLIAPTTSDDRLETMLEKARGFVYAISTTGVTGNTKSIGEEAEHLVNRAREHTSLPIAVGFGIATNSDLSDVLRYADAAVVGSAIVRRIADSESPESTIKNVRTYIEELLNKPEETEFGDGANNSN